MRWATRACVCAERDLPQGATLVRIVAYESTPDTPQALVALARGVEAKL